MANTEKSHDDLRAWRELLKATGVDLRASQPSDSPIEWEITETAVYHVRATTREEAEKIFLGYGPVNDVEEGVECVGVTERDIEPMPTVSLGVRAEHGRSAVRAGTPDHTHNDEATNLVDALANLMHYAVERDLGWTTALGSAERHVAAERSEINDGEETSS